MNDDDSSRDSQTLFDLGCRHDYKITIKCDAAEYDAMIELANGTSGYAVNAHSIEEALGKALDDLERKGALT